MNRMMKAATLVAKCKPASNKLGLEDVSKVVRTADTSWAYICNSFSYSKSITKLIIYITIKMKYLFYRIFKHKHVHILNDTWKEIERKKLSWHA